MGFKSLKVALIVTLVYSTVAKAGDTGGWTSSAAPACKPETTTVYSVATSYIEKTIEKTVVSTNIVHITETTTSVATVRLTDTVTTTQIQVQPTTIVNVNTITQISSSIVNVPVPTTIVNTVVNPTTIVSQQTITSVGVSTVTTTATTTISTCRTTLTGLVTCTSRIVNPTYTPPAPLPTDHLWGCAPGTICTPPQIDCNWEQNPPSEKYVCHPSECKPLPPITQPEDFNASWPNPTEADCAWYKPNPGLFNLNPRFFGLDFAIFDVYGQPVCPAPTTTKPSPTKTGWFDWATAVPSHSLTPRMPRRRSSNPLAELVHRQSLQVAPEECFTVFNGAQLTAQTIGHVYDRLCPPTSEFMVAVGNCRTCAGSYGGSSEDTDTFPELADYFDWCLDNAP